MIGAAVSSNRTVAASPRHGAENGRDEPLLARVMGATGLMLWEAREPGLVLTSLQAGVGPSLAAGTRPVDPGPEGRWMDVVRLALRLAPKQARAIFREIEKNDEKILSEIKRFYGPNG